MRFRLAFLLLLVAAQAAEVKGKVTNAVGWKVTLYGEVLNLTNHYNGRYAYESGIDPNTGQALVKTLQGFPITPTAGLVVQF